MDFTQSKSVLGLQQPQVYVMSSQPQTNLSLHNSGVSVLREYGVGISMTQIILKALQLVFYED